jgi:S1-C subfamily serine protease
MTQHPLLFRAWTLVVGVAMLISASLLSARERTEEARRKPSLAVAVEKVKPALVFLQQPKEKGKEEGKRSPYALGVIIDPTGTVVTNHSATRGFKKIDVLLSDGRRLPTKALFSDPDLDLAVIKIEDTRRLPYAEVGDSDKVKVGDRVLALSAPWTTPVDEPLMVVSGLIAGTRRGAKPGDFLFLVDTAIGPGCGAGPLMDREGKFVGLVVGGDRGPRSTNTAIPSNRVKERAAKWFKKT